MKRIFSICACLAVLAGARADHIELLDGSNIDGAVQGFFNQQFEIADAKGNITRVKLKQVTRIQFDPLLVMIRNRDRSTMRGQLIDLQEGLFGVIDKAGQKQRVVALLVDDLMITQRSGAITPPTSAAPAATPPSTPASNPARPASTPAAPAKDAKVSAEPQLGKVTIVDFYADWCGPCRAISPVLEKMASEDQRIELRKVDVDKHKELAQRHKVSSIPHIIIYGKDGEEVDTVIGANEPAVRAAVAKANGESKPGLLDRVTFWK